MSSEKCFQITQRHYDIIIEQGYKNLPKECGGFLGGKDMTISAISPSQYCEFPLYLPINNPAGAEPPMLEDFVLKAVPLK